jgi:hypothetical protein
VARRCHALLDSFGIVAVAAWCGHGPPPFFQRGDGGEARPLSPCSSSCRATASRRGCAPLDSSGGGATLASCGGVLPDSSGNGVTPSWLGAAAPVLYPPGTADGGEVRPLSSCFLLGRVMAAMGCRSLSFFFGDGATAARRVRSPPLLWRRGDGDQARWLPAGSSGGRVTAVRLGCSPPAPLV